MGTIVLIRQAAMRSAAVFVTTVHARAALASALAATVMVRGPRREDVYNVLWSVVFGFATLNIVSLAAKRLEPTRRGLSFGELMAVMVVLLSIFLLGWEMLGFLHIFPIQIRR